MTNLQIALVTYREKKHLTQPELAKILDCKREALANWETGRAIPRPNTLKKISELLSINTDYLLGLSTERNPKNATPIKEKLTDAQIALYNQTENLTEEQMLDVIKYVEFLKSKDNK